MSATEVQLTLTQTEVGMQLARALINANGQVLMPQGTVLTKAILSTLHKRDVTELWVTLPAPDGIDPDVHDAEEIRQHHKERLQRLFRKTTSTEENHFLQQLMHRYRKVDAP